MANVNTSVNYELNFDSSLYSQTYCQKVARKGEKGNYFNFVLDSLHQIFEAGHISGGKLLDIGTGPTIHSILNASRYVEDIHLSDFAPQNINFLRNWWHGDMVLSQEILNYDMELANDRRSITEFNKEIKTKVSNVLRIDVTKENPLLDCPYQPTYDVITSSLCLEVATETEVQYEHAVKNVTKLLKEGGFFVLIGVSMQSYYKIGDMEFPGLSISETSVRNVLERSGYNIIVWKDMDFDQYIQHESLVHGSDYEGAFVILAQKIVHVEKH